MSESYRRKNGLFFWWFLLILMSSSVAVTGTPALGGSAARRSKKSASRTSRSATQNPQPKPSASNASPVENDPSLAAIRDYQVQEMRSVPSVQVEQLDEAVNPFPAKKGGRFHGSLYEYHRNDNFDARNFFDPVGEPLPEYKRNQFGLSMGLALGERFNLMGAYDGLRIVQGSTLLSHLPTAAMKNGDFSALLRDPANPIQLKDPLTGHDLVDNQIPSDRISPVSRRLLSLFPDPNRQDPDRNYVNNQPVVRNHNTYDFRMDYELNDVTKLSASYNLGNSNDRLVRDLPTFGVHRAQREQDYRLGLNRSFTSRLLGDWSFRFVRSRYGRISDNSGQTGLLQSLGIQGLEPPDPSYEGYPNFDLSGYVSLGDYGSPETSVFNGFFFSNYLTYAMTSHTLSFGFDWGTREYNQYQNAGVARGSFGFDGYYSGDAFADFLFGIPSSAAHSIGTNRADFRGRTYRLSARDSWKVDPKLSVSYGVAYEYFPGYRSVHDNISSFFPLLVDPPPDGDMVVPGTPSGTEVGLFDGQGGDLVMKDRNNLSPSLSVAYRPLGSNRLVWRASYNIDHGPLDPSYFINYLGRNYPFYYVVNAQASIDQPDLNLTTPFETAVPAELNVTGIESNIRNYYVQNWRFSIEGELSRYWNLQAAYEGSKGTRLTRVVPGNIPLPGPGEYQSRRPNPDYGRFSIVTSGGSSIGHTLDMDLERRLADGIAVSSGFRWSRIFTDTFWGNPGNPRDLAAERAPAGYVPPRSFFLRYIVDLPFGKGRALGPQGDNWAQWIVQGWQLSGITHIQDGLPFSVYLNGDLNNDSLDSDRPDRIGSGKLDSSERSVDGWFDTGAFTEPAPYTYGNSGKNILSAPGYQNWDMSIIKQTHLNDGDLVELRIELFNAFNQVNFQEPVHTYGTSTFGKIFGAGRSREIEVALKYSF